MSDQPQAPESTPYVDLSMEVLECSLRCLAVHEALGLVEASLDEGSPARAILARCRGELASANIKMTQAIDNDLL